MYAGMAATPGMATSWYFTSFYTLALLIGLNLVIGSILDIYTTLKVGLRMAPHHICLFVLPSLLEVTEVGSFFFWGGCVL